MGVLSCILTKSTGITNMFICLVHSVYIYVIKFIDEDRFVLCAFILMCGSRSAIFCPSLAHVTSFLVGVVGDLLEKRMP